MRELGIRERAFQFSDKEAVDALTKNVPLVCLEFFVLPIRTGWACLTPPIIGKLESVWKRMTPLGGLPGQVSRRSTPAFDVPLPIDRWRSGWLSEMCRSSKRRDQVAFQDFDLGGSVVSLS